MFYSFFATDFNTRKYRNLIKNGRIALVVDSYRSVGNKAICVQDRTTIIDRGKEIVYYTKYSIETHGLE
jgi:hypothetical protein